VLRDPVEAFEGEGESEDVFEDDEAGEGFNCEITLKYGRLAWMVLRKHG